MAISPGPRTSPAALGWSEVEVELEPPPIRPQYQRTKPTLEVRERALSPRVAACEGSRFRLTICGIFGSPLCDMPPYNKMPTPQEWITRVGTPQMAPMTRITALIGRYNEISTKQQEEIKERASRAQEEIKERASRAQEETEIKEGRSRGRFGAIGAADALAQQKDLEFIRFQIERACQFVKKYGFGRAEEKLGGSINAQQLKAVEELQTFVLSELKKSLQATDDKDYEDKVIERFGKKVNEAEVKADEDLRKKDMLREFLTPQQQKELKLSFRNGLAHKWTFDQEKKGKLEIYDTARFRDANFSEDNGSLYVVDKKGAFYVYGKETEKLLKHSSLLAGAAVLCAGTIRIEEGEVKWLTGQSGHYMPKVENLVGVLERLRQYQVDLTNVKVFRRNETEIFVNGKGYPGKFYEPCNAMELLAKRTWPTGERPNALFVKKFD